MYCQLSEITFVPNFEPGKRITSFLFIYLQTLHVKSDFIKSIFFKNFGVLNKKLEHYWNWCYKAPLASTNIGVLKI